jgi:hypothetical protein
VDRATESSTEVSRMVERGARKPVDEEGGGWTTPDPHERGVD